MSRGKQVEIFRTDVKIKDFYDFYAVKTFKTKINKYCRIDKTSPYCMSLQEYSNLISEMNLLVVDMLLHEAFEFKMPSNLGSFAIRKKKVEPYIDEDGNFVNPLPINRRATKELWDSDPEAKELGKMVYHHNEHSNGYIAKGYYNKRIARYAGKGKYFLKVTRSIKHKITEIMTDPYSKYDFFII